MRLTKVQVTGLFGIFNHEIPLNLEERITILHGPNGFGKTIVLRMIAALTSGDYSLFLEVPFKTFVVEFDNGLQVSVKRSAIPDQNGDERQSASIDLKLSAGGEGESLSWSSSFASIWGRDEGNTIEQVLRKSPASGVLRDFLLAISDKQPKRIHKLYQIEPEWSVRVRAEFPKVGLVRTQRLDVVEYDPDVTDGDEEISAKPTVDAYASYLAERIRKTLAQYAARSQELDRTFPTRLLGEPVHALLTAEELRRQLAELELKRADLTQLGFLDAEQGITPASSYALEGKREVLSIYVADMHSKLSIFDEVASKIELFVRIINSRFLLKHLEIHREHGFVFKSSTGARLKPTDLSSGEQHELILFYELIFQLQENALVLIDEPEISLHVAWQEKFLEDLSEVVKLSGVDVVLATHSPEIIGDHWDLTVELKGPSESRQG